MIRWVLNYDFTSFGEKLSLGQWHEIELDRKDNDKTGVNGAVSLWWNINDKITTGLQYRYADNKLGNNTYQSATIYSLKYNF